MTLQWRLKTLYVVQPYCFPPLLLFFLSSCSSPLLLSGQSSLCLLYLLSHLFKELSGQPSYWPLGSAVDEAILIPSGITAKLVVFPLPDCSCRVRTFRQTDLHPHRHLRTELNAASQPLITQRALGLQRHSECILIV